MIDDTRVRSLLRGTFGHDSFRPHQEPIIDSILAGRSVLGVLPTGGGKSLCYQLPSMLLPGATLVISPLIALMKDQVDALPPDLHARATVLNSSLEFDDLKRREREVAAGGIRLIYAAPERLRQQAFLELLRQIDLSLVVVDEAHCVSVWGHDFRPDYLFIRKALDSLPPVTLLALTATATPEMQAEIAEQLGREMEVVAAPTYRPNLKFEVLRCGNVDDKMARLLTVCQETFGSGIVYTRSRENAEKVATFLRRRRVQAEFYHAGMDRESRRQVQERFMLGRTRMIVATIAFGMGIDKANVRLVAHFQLPESLESYTQEAGRAGRDGKSSRCVMLYSPSDKASLTSWLRREAVKLEDARDVYRAIKERIPAGKGSISADDLQYQVFRNRPEGAETRLRVAISLMERAGMLVRHTDSGRDLSIEILKAPAGSRGRLEQLLDTRDRHEAQRLKEVAAYAEGMECRHAVISRHFGQSLAGHHSEQLPVCHSERSEESDFDASDRCGQNCDVCRGTAEPPKAAQKVAFPPSAEQVPDVGRTILQCLDSVPFRIGRTGLSRVLGGTATSPVPKEESAFFGVLEGFTLHRIRGFMDELIASGHIIMDRESEYYELIITDAGRAALDNGEVILGNPNRQANRRSFVPRDDLLSTGRVTRREAVEDEPTEDEADRFEKLRQWRRIVAHKAELPPYVVFHDSTLRMIARSNPGSLKELAEVPGIGPNKLTAYGKQVISLLTGATDGIG